MGLLTRFAEGVVTLLGSPTECIVSYLRGSL